MGILPVTLLKGFCQGPWSMADIQNVYLQMGRDSKDCTHLLRKRITGTKCQILKKSSVTTQTQG